jgi:hypothetical protein
MAGFDVVVAVAGAPLWPANPPDADAAHNSVEQTAIPANRHKI